MKKTILTTLALIFSFNTFALENGSFKCLSTYENEDGRTEVETFRFKMTDLYLQSFDEDGSLGGIFAINAGWILDRSEEDSIAYKVERDDNKVVMQFSEAPFDSQLQKPIDIKDHYSATSTILESEDGSIMIITRSIDPNYPDDNSSSVSACTRQ